MFKAPKIQKPKPPPSTPTRADASVIDAGLRAVAPLASLVTSGSMRGLTRRASTQKTTLLGGGS